MLIYEMLVGVVPFHHKNQNILFNNILEKEVLFRQEDLLSENAKSLITRVFFLIKQLLNKNPAARLGNKGADEIKQHPWFAGVSFQDVLAKNR